VSRRARNRRRKRGLELWLGYKASVPGLGVKQGIECEFEEREDESLGGV
jgi:hypothetical protein